MKLSGVEVLEFGAGASTVYFAKRSRKVISYEFNDSYYTDISRLSIEFPNAEILNCDSTAAKSCPSETPLLEFEKDEKLVSCLEADLKMIDKKAKLMLASALANSVSKNISEADIIFVDAGPRNSVLALAALFAKESAVVVVDNSEQPYVAVGINLLYSAGFYEIPFDGMGPINPYKWRTSIFVKSLESLSLLSKSQHRQKIL